MAAYRQRDEALQQLVRAMAGKDAYTLMAALTVAEAAKVAPGNLQRGRDALSSAKGYASHNMMRKATNAVRADLRLVHGLDA